MTKRSLRNFIDQKIEELGELRVASPKQCYLWSAQVLGELQPFLKGAPPKYVESFYRKWTDHEVDEQYIPSQMEIDDGDYEEDDDGSYIQSLHTSYTEPTYVHFGRDRIILGTLTREQIPKVRYEWLSQRLTWLLEVLTLGTSILDGLGSPRDAVMPPEATAPPFQKITAGSEQAELVAKVMRTRWNAAEDLQKRGFADVACILYGSLFEALLVSYLEQTVDERITLKYGKDAKGNVQPVRRWTKVNLFRAAKETVGLANIVDNLEPSVRNFRDLIHIHSEHGLKGLHYQANEAAARILREGLQILFDSFEEKVQIPTPNGS